MDREEKKATPPPTVLLFTLDIEMMGPGGTKTDHMISNKGKPNNN